MLIDEQMTECVLYDVVRVPDGYGAFDTQYIESAPFNCAIVLNNSTEMQVAMAEGVKGVYNVVTKQNITLTYHDIFKRKSDNKIFRVTSNGNDNKTPRSSSLDMRVVTAEEWEIPYE